MTKLADLNLYRNDLQVPEGAPMSSRGGMVYESREAVAAFQACLK